MEAIVTRHGAARTKDRVGLSKKIADKNAQAALDCGVTHAETKGSLRRYIDGLYLSKKAANNIRIYNHYVYIFQNNVLITVIDLPQKYRKLASQLQQKKAKK